MHHLAARLNCRGKSVEALQFYAQILEGHMAVAGIRQKNVQTGQLRAVDDALSFEASDIWQAKRVFTALAEQGEVISPFQAVGPAVSGGSVIDKFGKLWIVSCASARRLLCYPQ